MSYFAAAVGRSAGHWQAVDLDLDTVESLEDIAEVAIDAHPDAAESDGPIVVLFEQEDEWFAVVRIDDDPRAFVSDLAAAMRHAMGEVLLPDELSTLGLDDIGELDVAELQSDDLEVTDSPVVTDTPTLALTPHEVAGHSDVLDDLGLAASDLVQIAQDLAPPAAISAIAKALGCADELEEIR